VTAPRFNHCELAGVTGGRWIGTPPRDVEGIGADTRTLGAGALFVAIKGDRFDGHDFLAAAAQAGAAAAVVQADRAAGIASPPIPLLAVADTVPALGALARFHRLRFDLPVVAVTGTNGKTTTREMIAAILAKRGRTLKNDGNFNNEIGVPLTLFGLDAEHRAAVIEMGMNHAGEIARLADIARPQIGVVTNAGAGHLEGLGSIDGVADAKGELYLGLPPTGVAIVNADDARMLKRAQASGRRILSFAVGRQRRGDVVVLDIPEHGPEGMRFVLGVGNRELEVELPLVGAHNAANAAAAAAAAIALGCTDREIVAGLRDVRPVGRRLRVERLASGLRLIDDCYNANPLSMGAALQTLHDLVGDDETARPVAVLGDMLELGAHEAEAHRGVGEAAARAGVQLLAAFGPRSRTLADAAAAAGLPADRIFHTEEIDALVAWAREHVQPTDFLLVKASRGMKLERLVEALR
jgi:UDP-N-acetylmuramoyl-tripeptide--D-alanyl-D-alanine ligase